MTRSSNPVLSGIIRKYQRSNKVGYGSPYNSYTHNSVFGLPPQSYSVDVGSFSPIDVSTPTRAITYDDIVARAGITLGFVILTTIVEYLLMANNYSIGFFLGVAGGIAALVAVIVDSFRSRKRGSSKAVTIVYACAEGFFLGWFTWLIAFQIGKTERFPWIAAQALLATCGVFVGMLGIYKSKAIRVTPRFNKMVFSAIVGVLFLVIGSQIISLFSHHDILRDGGIISIMFSFAVIGIGALSFLTDFDNAASLVEIGAPEKESWGVALGLTVTIVWLYTEILRLLSYFVRSE